ncbi:MAG: hypothetical protein LBQ02_02860 [Candidatus Nomurabacteria bacterium]|jgi:hypothetical protein|nr:hypothetical protein [Candidatus Nomurabacteria bacterium]
MDNADYLNQISGGKLDKKVNPKTGKVGFQLPFGLGLNHKTFIILGAILVAVVGLIAMMMVAQQATSRLKGLAYSVGMRSINLNEVVGKYHSSIKNSNLKSLSNDLKTVLANFNRDYPAVWASIQGAGDGTAEAVDTEESVKLSLDNAFTSASMNAILDRNFALEMSYQAEYMALRIHELQEQTENASLQASYDEFMTIKQRFDDWIATH